MNALSTPWFVYVLRCADDSLYTGITTDVARRVNEHNSDDRLGARYTRSRRPVELFIVETAASRADAARREAAIKRMSRAQKVRLAATGGGTAGRDTPHVRASTPGHAGDAPRARGTRHGSATS